LSDRRANYHHGDLARALVDASLELLALEGPEAFTLRAAAKRAGVNHRAVYRHFQDKRALLAKVAEGGYRMLAADMDRATSTGGTSRDRLLALAEAYLRFARREPARFIVMFGRRLNEDGREQALEEAIREALRVLARELDAMSSAQTEPRRRDAGITLWASVHGLSALVVARRVPLADRHVHAYVRTVMGPVVDGIMRALA
jgi:AcrR family transcriptional regulator